MRLRTQSTTKYVDINEVLAKGFKDDKEDEII